MTSGTSISLVKLKKGTKILLETIECVFELELVSPTKGRVRISGGKRFPNKTDAFIVGSYGCLDKKDNEKLQKYLELEKGMGLQIKYKDNDGINIEFITSSVVTAKITGISPEGEAWDFEVWPDTERQAKMDKAVKDAVARLRLVEDKGGHKDKDKYEDTEP